jgi:signal peptidase II
MKEINNNALSNGLKKIAPFIITILFLLFLIDRISKYFAINKLSTHGVYFFKKIFYFNLQTNTGIAFSIPLPKIMIIILTIIIIYALIFYVYNYKNKLSLFKIFLISLVIIGAISNLLDRLLYGHVIDFINISIWPTFNLSDSYIFIAIFILTIMNLENKKHRVK